MKISNFPIFANNGMMGIKIWVFEAAESIPGLIFIPSVIIFDLEGPRPFFCLWAWEFFDFLNFTLYSKYGYQNMIF